MEEILFELGPKIQMDLVHVGTVFIKSYVSYWALVWSSRVVYNIFGKEMFYMGELKHQEAKKLFMVMENKSQLSSCVLFSDPISSLSIGSKEVSVDTRSNSVLLFPIRVLQDLERL